MIAEKHVQLDLAPPKRMADVETPSAKQTHQVSEAEMLEALAADIRRDANEQALFYLIRSNTGYDGE
ncbi:hypothetical protein [Rhodopirellula sp. MGV]|uniref:hypothetical protein n=1 Tax=Rhodopirellula sp. MGV TaxID=2023130 RepID=UPI000B972CD8|nr:hypothetical protein [Rhodopirellula sp. MGV]OYP28210.1 hypothetical protein CGZ80_27360 [Rhodopirellula sp. MGV]PNY34394.1 hypothetical protein C2E31_23360 [Rhodopirellula baltica]